MNIPLTSNGKVPPFIHMNGTSVEVLLKEYTHAMDAVADASNALCAVTFNPRDYYMMDLKAQDDARKHNLEMRAKLNSVYENLLDMVQYLDAINESRKERKAN